MTRRSFYFGRNSLERKISVSDWEARRFLVAVSMLPGVAGQLATGICWAKVMPSSFIRLIFGIFRKRDGPTSDGRSSRWNPLNCLLTILEGWPTSSTGPWPTGRTRMCSHLTEWRATTSAHGRIWVSCSGLLKGRERKWPGLSVTAGRPV